MENTNNKNARGTSQDRQRVAASQDWEISYMTKKYNVSGDEVQRAIKAVGNAREKVEEFLSSKN